MENELVGEENNIYTEEINNKIVLRYKLKYFSKNYMEQPIFKNWLNKEMKKYDYKYLSKCRDCNCFVFGGSGKVKCCENPYFESICMNCGSVYYGHSYCCLKTAIKSDFGEYLLDGYYTCNRDNTDGLIECAKAFPLVFHIAFTATTFCALFFHRRGTNRDNINSSFASRLTKLSKYAVIIMHLNIVFYTLLFFIPLSFVHLIYLFIFFIGYQPEYNK